MRPAILLLLLTVNFVACQKAETISPEMLSGVWIEKTNRQDTIIFQPGASVNMLQVNRGKEINVGGYLVPKLGSGFYQYYIKADKISVYNLWGSTILFTDYTFEVRDGELHLDNFFELGFHQPATATRTLVRLR